ncbi:MAG TPA: hypothetical protein VH277_01985, partial [Gemmatimonadaceae bacterium]|nr:hypothetical protein [Gemmatimonadaceae bacterium]
MLGCFYDLLTPTREVPGCFCDLLTPNQEVHTTHHDLRDHNHHLLTANQEALSTIHHPTPTKGHARRQPLPRVSKHSSQNTIMRIQQRRSGEASQRSARYIHANAAILGPLDTSPAGQQLTDANAQVASLAA